MQMVVDFLLEYYVWVLIVLVILLITVVGFLADTKKKKKLREKGETSNNGMPANDQSIANQGIDTNYNTMGQNMNMGYNDINNGMMMNQNYNNMMNPNTDNMINNNMQNNNMIGNQDMNMSNSMTQNMNQNINMMPNMNESMNNMTSNVNPSIEPNISVAPTNNSFENTYNTYSSVVPNQTIGTPSNVTPSIGEHHQETSTGSSDSFFIPASDQTPKFEPREVVIPKPVEPSPIFNNTNNGMGSVVTPVTEPREVPSMPTPSVMPNTVLMSEQVQSHAPEMNTVWKTQMGEQAPASIPNAMPQMAGPSVIPNANIPSTPVVEPLAQTPSMSNNIPGGIPNTMPNTMPNMNQMSQEPVNTMNGYNSNLVQGGSNFVMNGNVPNNQNNGNWNL